MTTETTPRTCSVCGGPLRRNNKIGICNRNPECLRLSWNQHQRARYAAQSGPARTCSVCGGSLNRNSKIGICNRNPECRWAYHRQRAQAIAANPDKDREQTARRREARRARAAERRSSAPARTCSICGGPIQRNNKVGICRRNPECKAEAMRERKRAYRAANPDHERAYRAANPDKVRAWERRRRARAAERRDAPARTCSICGGPLRSDNKIGICSRNPECKRAVGLARKRAYRAANPDKVRATDRRYREARRRQQAEIVDASVTQAL